MLINSYNYQEILSEYINKILNTNEFTNIFGTLQQKEKLKNGLYLGGKEKKIILAKAKKCCDIKDLTQGKFIFTEIYDDVCLDKFNNHPLYQTYHGIKQRCYNTNDENYKNYGERGISMCEEWLNNKNGIRNFIKWSEENGYMPNKGLSIDRKDNDGNYEPNNCRYVTQDIQLLNRRNPKKNTINYEESRMELFNDLYLISLYFNGHLYPVGTFLNKDDAIKAKNKLRTFLVNKLLKEKDNINGN